MDVLKTVTAIIQVIVAIFAALSATGIIDHNNDLNTTLIAIAAAAGGAGAGKDASNHRHH